MKIVLWIGNESNQLALAKKINDLYLIDTVFLETKNNKSRITFGLILKKIIEKIFLSTISKSWFGMLSYYKKTDSILSHVNVLHTKNINSEDVYLKTKLINPELIIVSGTSLIKDKLLSLTPKLGILNLHTGLSPYMKGGPNCTNWCIANNQFHLIGNTIMWIDKGIDSGRIVTSELTVFDGHENLLNVHIKVMEHAHELYLKAIRNIANGKLFSVSQVEIDSGKVYFTKDWTLYEKFRLKINFTEFKVEVKSNKYKQKQLLLKTIILK